MKFRLFAYTRFGEKYSKTREILRGKALLAPAAFLPEGANRFYHASAEVRLQFSPYFACKLTQFYAISRERAQKPSCYCASLRATRMRSHEIHWTISVGVASSFFPQLGTLELLLFDLRPLEGTGTKGPSPSCSFGVLLLLSVPKSPCTENSPLPFPLKELKPPWALWPLEGLAHITGSDLVAKVALNIKWLKLLHWS